MGILFMVLGGAGAFLVGAFRLLRGAPSEDDKHPDAAAQGAAYFGLAVLIVDAFAWYPLILSGPLMLFALLLPVLLGGYALAVARKPLTGVIGALCYVIPLVVVWVFLRRSM